ncbi:MAG: hypothetical protein ACK4UJ_09630 [Leptonema sp. (in: bacteria)]
MIPYFLSEGRRNKKFFIQFGGQGNSFLKELQILYEQKDLKEFFDVAFDAIQFCLSREDIKSELDIYYPKGFPLKAWLEKKETPAENYLSNCTITFPGNQITQLGTLYLFTKYGYEPDEFLNYVHSTTGHSGGLQASVIFALGKKGKDLLNIIYKFIIWYTIAAYHAQKAYGFPQVDKELLEWSLTYDRHHPYPMVVVAGMEFEEISTLIEKFHNCYPEVNEFPLKISLINGKNIFVVTGHAKDLVSFRREFYSLFLEKKIQWNYVPVSIPFHRSDTMKEKIIDFFNDEACKSLGITGKDLKIPVISFTDGSNLQYKENIPVYLADIMMNQVLYWEKSISPLLSSQSHIDYVLDFGPGKITTILTKTALQYYGLLDRVSVISFVGRSGISQMLKKTD